MAQKRMEQQATDKNTDNFPMDADTVRRELQTLLDKWAEGLPDLSMALHVKLVRVAEDDSIQEVVQCSLFSGSGEGIRRH